MSISSVCGNTPLIRISEKLYAKLETYNPTGSVKDRMISFVVDEAVRRGEIGPGTTLCDATSGNTGIALSAVADIPVSNKTAKAVFNELNINILL